MYSCGTIDTMSTDTKDTVTTSLRLASDLDYRIGLLAAKERKSKAQWIREALKLVVERMEAVDA